ncbi:BPL-N domain-containing protein [Stenotrophomonas sp. 24(2023)]|uniref:BPL-N domain-containing protein n=1 Tax=Stenotrophomonas sp. 24(2023) TaxID=3068324 RepID=UPI0027E06C25|nr:BPL-N domain-containing protein [Stenotrophomonas sp. 24(2023)]WMJ68029.1 BPL-N domain-containing protein [Stenotrophomonas sp. 24(2023)]
MSRRPFRWQPGVWLAALLLLPVGIVQAAADATVARIAVYRGEAGCPGCSEAVQAAIERQGPRYRVDFVGPDEAVDVTEVTRERYVAYVQPGGGQDIQGAFAALGDAQAAAIGDFVEGGGRFIGLCMGAYLAGASYLGLLPQDLDAEAGRPGFPVHGIDDAAVPVQWNGRQESAFFQDGPYLPSAGAAPGFRVIARYANGDLAAARYAHGKGVVVLTGPHPEAPPQWFDEAEIPRSQMPRSDLFKDVLDASLR